MSIRWWTVLNLKKTTDNFERLFWGYLEFAGDDDKLMIKPHTGHQSVFHRYFTWSAGVKWQSIEIGPPQNVFINCHKFTSCWSLNWKPHKFHHECRTTNRWDHMCVSPLCLSAAQIWRLEEAAYIGHRNDVCILVFLLHHHLHDTLGCLYDVLQTMCGRKYA